MKRQLSQIYLSAVPILTIVLGLGIGYISYKIYLPVWLLNVVLIIASMKSLAVHKYSTEDNTGKRYQAHAALRSG